MLIMKDIGSDGQEEGFSHKITNIYAIGFLPALPNARQSVFASPLCVWEGNCMERFALSGRVAAVTGRRKAALAWQCPEVLGGGRCDTVMIDI